MVKKARKSEMITTGLLPRDKLLLSREEINQREEINY